MFTMRKNILTIALVVAAAYFANVNAQCVDSPDGKTAVRFDNASSYEVTFYIEGAKVATQTAHTTSRDVYVVPGGHFLSASAATTLGELWVYSANVVPKGQVCTWHVGDPGSDIDDDNDKDL